MTATVKPTLTQPAVSKLNTLPSLGPGTLILADGSILPVLSPPTPFITQRPPVISNPAPLLFNQQTLVVVTTKCASTTTLTAKTTQALSKTISLVNKSLAYIKPKRCTTKTVQANKVPIPALTSKYANSCIVLSGNVQQKPQQKKITEGKPKKETEKQCNEGSDTLKRKLEGAAKNDSIPAKQQRAATTKNVIARANNDTAVNTEVPSIDTNSSEDKSEQKKVTSYSIDSICKEKGEQNADFTTEKVSKTESVGNVKDTSNQPAKVTGQISRDSNVEQNTPQIQTEDTPVISSTVESSLSQACTLTQSHSKVDEIPDNVLKEIEKKTVTDTASKDIEINLPHSELSNDIFASLQVQSGGQNPESTSPTAAFLLAFPLVSTLTGVKVSEVIEEDNSDSQRGTPTLLQIGTMDTTKPTQSNADNLTPSLLNLDNFSFFSSKDICSNFYQPFDTFVASTTASTQVTTVSTSNMEKCDTDKKKTAVDTNANNKNIKVVYEPPTTKERVFASTDNFASKTETIQHKASQVFSNHQDCARIGTSESSKDMNRTLNKALIAPPQQQQQQQHNPVSVDNSLSATYNTYYTPGVSVYNTTNQFEGKQTTQKSKSASMNNYNMLTTRTSYTAAQCNTFNPFAETVKYTSSSVCCYNPVTKPYIDSLYTNPSTYNYNCQSDVSFNQSSYSMHKNPQRTTEEKPYYNYNNSYNGDTRTNVFSNNYCQMHNLPNHNKDKLNAQPNKNKTTNNQTRPPVNWMTTPDIRHQSSTNNDYLLPCFGKELENIPNSVYQSASFSVTSNTQTTYFNTNTSIYPTPELTYTFSDVKKTLESNFPSVSSFQRNDLDDNQFTWSPTKLPQLLDPSHSFVSSALPTLVGDLALGNTSMAFSDHKLDTSNKNKDTYKRRHKPSNYENHVNFLSVSQLVDHNKGETMPARTATRRNSGNRANKPTVQQKPVKRHQKDGKDNQNYHSVSNNNKSSDKSQLKQSQVVQNNSYNSLSQSNQEWIADSAKQVKNPSNSYSAEALIGHQSLSDDVASKQRNNNTVQGQCGYSAPSSLPVSFLTENIIPYFPPVELQQDTTTFVQNQNCQNNSFSHTFSSASIQSNAYSSGSLITSAPSITTNYLPTANFMSDITAHDYNPVISDNINIFSHPPTAKVDSKTCMKNTNTIQKQVNRQDERKPAPAMSNPCSGNNFPKKARKKHTNESNNMPGFVDFSFLSMPTAINSPILPDDFHANLLPPPTPQLYPCKNPLYPKQNSELNAGGTLLPLPPVPVSRSNIQHPDISPSVNNVGTSLTNFNLSTIFPEINKVSFMFLPVKAAFKTIKLIILGYSTFTGYLSGCFQSSRV